METTFCQVYRQIPNCGYSLSLNRLYPGRVCVEVVCEDSDYSWIKHLLVDKRSTEVIIEGNWFGWELTDDSQGWEPVSDAERHAEFIDTVEKTIDDCLEDAFGGLPIRNLPHAPAKHGFYQTYNDGHDFSESFAGTLLEYNADDWKERHVWVRLQRRFRQRLQREKNLRIMRDVLDAWFERSLRPDGATGRRVIATLSSTSYTYT
jgi:hypothetical protein